MLSFLLGLVLGALGGFIGGLFFYAKKVHKRITNEEISRETVNALIKGEAPQGDFIRVSKVEEYLKTHDGEIRLGDILEDDN